MDQQVLADMFPIVPMKDFEGGLAGFLGEIGIEWKEKSQWSCNFQHGVVVTMWEHLLTGVEGIPGMYEYRIDPRNAPEKRHMKKLIQNIRDAANNRLMILGVVIKAKPTVNIPAVGMLTPGEGYREKDGAREGACKTRFAVCDGPVYHLDQSVSLTIRDVIDVDEIRVILQVLRA
jgi:hypothetical protein